MNCAKVLCYVACVTVATGLAACSSSSSGGGSANYGTGDPHLAAANFGNGPIDPFLADGKAVLLAFDTIAAQSGKPLRVTSLNADRTNGLTVNVQEPKNHLNVDAYVIAPDGKMTGPTPVKMVSLDGGPVTAKLVDDTAFDPYAIGWSRLTQTAREAIARTHLADARISQWEIDGTHAGDKRFIYLDAPRGRPVAEVDPKLHIIRMSF